MLGYSTRTGTLGWAWLLHRGCLATTLWANQIGLIKWANQMGLIEWEGGLITNPTGATQWGATGHRSLIHREGD